MILSSTKTPKNVFPKIPQKLRKIIPKECYGELKGRRRKELQHLVIQIITLKYTSEVFPGFHVTHLLMAYTKRGEQDFFTLITIEIIMKFLPFFH